MTMPNTVAPQMETQTYRGVTFVYDPQRWDMYDKWMEAKDDPTTGDTLVDFRLWLGKPSERVPEEHRDEELNVLVQLTFYFGWQGRHDADLIINEETFGTGASTKGLVLRVPRQHALAFLRDNPR